MAAIRATDNRAERKLRAELHALGLRFRKYVQNLPGKPDIVFVGPHIAVFVDGDYWHSRILKEQGLEALRRSLRKRDGRQYWIEKFKRNVERDKEVDASLREMRWVVLRIWESDLKGRESYHARRILNLIRRSLPTRKKTR